MDDRGRVLLVSAGARPPVDEALDVETMSLEDFVSLTEPPPVRAVVVCWEGDPQALQEAMALCRRARIPCLVAVPQELLPDFSPPPEADDFVVMPLRRGELGLRVRRLLDRLRPRGGERLLKAGDVVVNQDSYEVFVAGKRTTLTYKEYQLLSVLMSSPGRVFSREALLSQVWGYDYFGGTRTVDVHIRRLRSKLQASETTAIETVWNVGYRLVVRSPTL